jgi:hypothetical protein
MTIQTSSPHSKLPTLNIPRMLIDVVGLVVGHRRGWPGEADPPSGGKTGSLWARIARLEDWVAIVVEEELSSMMISNIVT